MRCSVPGAVLAQLADCIALAGVTPPGDADDVADWVVAWCIEMGASVARQEVWPGASNVIASFAFGPGPRLVFNTHLDVVDPAGQRWRTPPFEAHVADGRMHGRGACDAKGSLVAMLAALERLAGEPRGVAGSLLLTAVVGEEAGGLGSARLVQDGFTADAAVVGEPTELRVARAHKGTYMHRVRFAGRAAHSASPHLGHNAVADAAAFVALCEASSVQLARRPHPLLGPATLTVTTIAGGTFQNTVPDAAVLTTDRRLVPGETHAAADEQREALVAQLARARPGCDIDVETIVATVPSETPADAAIVRAALRATNTAEAVGFNAGCDMSKLVGAGIPTVICGPGSLAQAHAPDEFVPAAEVVDAVGVYERIARAVLRT